MRKPRVLRQDRLEFSDLSVNKIVIVIVVYFVCFLGKAMLISELISVTALACCFLYYSWIPLLLQLLDRVHYSIKVLTGRLVFFDQRGHMAMVIVKVFSKNGL